MKTQHLIGIKAREYLPTIIGDNKAFLITPIKDMMNSGRTLGHLIGFENGSFSISGSKLYYKRFTDAQTSLYLKGSFYFVGTDGDMFHYLINNRFSGKYSMNNILIDKTYQGMISFEFIQLLRKYLIREY